MFDQAATAASSHPGVVRVPSGGRQLIQVKVFDFDSALQRMSAIVWDPVAQRCFVSLKGSPEMVAALCAPGNGT